MPSPPFRDDSNLFLPRLGLTSDYTALLAAATDVDDDDGCWESGDDGNETRPEAALGMEGNDAGTWRGVGRWMGSCPMRRRVEQDRRRGWFMTGCGGRVLKMDELGGRAPVIEMISRPSCTVPTPSSKTRPRPTAARPTTRANRSSTSSTVSPTSGITGRALSSYPGSAPKPERSIATLWKSLSSLPGRASPTHCLGPLLP